MADKTEKLDFIVQLAEHVLQITDSNVSHVENATSDLTCVSHQFWTLRKKCVCACVFFLSSNGNIFRH